MLVGLAAFVYRTLLPKFTVRSFKYKVSDVAHLSDDFVEIKLQPESKALNFRAGQFVFVKFSGPKAKKLGRESHPFSIASPPTSQNISLIIKSLGDFTEKLQHLKPGVLAEVEGAYGRFGFTHFSKRQQFWIAGGVGITPFLSLAGDLNDRSPDVILIHSVNHKSELIKEDFFSGLGKSKKESFKYWAFSVDEQKGFLTAQTIKERFGDLKNSEFFICGPPVMMQTISRQLRELGVPKKQIHSEEFSLQ